MRQSMRRMVVFAAAAMAVVPPAARLAAQAPPSTDIYLAPLARANGLLVVGAPVNITNRPGYDNQPSFTPDNKSILYTSVRDDGQSDIYRYDVAAKKISRVTTTAESEYSATVTPAGNRFSVIRVERDSTQRLWSFALDGSDPKLVIDALKPVGYHAWLDATCVVTFVLGRPNALVFVDIQSKKIDTLARNIGRSLARIPDGSGFSYAQIADSTTMLRGMDPSSRRGWDIVALPRGSQDIVWLSDTELLTASGSRLLAWRKGDAQWRTIADLGSEKIGDVSRLAVSADRKWLAIVGVPKTD